MESDSPAARVWAKTPRIPVSEVEFLRNEGFHAQASERTRQFLDHLSVPLIRMDKSCDQLPAKSGTNLTLLLNKNIAPETINPLSGSGGDLSPNPWRQVLVVGSVRTGTTVFRKFLASSSLYTDFNETFHPHLHGSRNWFFWLTRLGPVHPMEYHQLWPRFLRQSKFDPEIALVDVKTEAIHLLRDQNLNRAWPPFLMCDPKIETVLIRMKRRNVLSQVLSYEKLLKTGQAIATESGVPKAGVWLDPGTVLQKIEDYQRREFEVDKLIGKANLYLDYEDLFDEQGMFSSEVIQKCKDLFPETQVDFDANPNFRKMGKPTDLQNREEISEVLRNTPYAWMLEQF
ncbi:MAG: hypothetical protein LAT58_14285 [Opitutales bacterium]|nr:hypothetical protein [Opitutales bacterium]